MLNLQIVRKHAYILLTIIVVAVTGCDSFRRLAGRPTSADIAVKRARIEAEEAAHQARLDSLRKVQKAVADSIELQDLVRSSGTMVTKGSAVRGLSLSGLSKRYYIVVGTFGSRDNAKYLAARAENAGYAATLIPFNNGFTAVGLEGTDKLAVCWDALGKIGQEPFCPKDAWILVNE